MKTTLNTLYHQAEDWLRELDFYKEELSILWKRLEEVVSANTNRNILKEVEHFQNKFILLRQQVDILKHDVNMANHAVTETTKTMPEHIDEAYVGLNTGLLDRMKDFSENITSTRFDFNRFLMKTL